MVLVFADTIVALITGAPPSAVAWIRMSGPDAWAIASRVFVPWPDPVVSHHAHYGQWSHGDDGLALPFEATRSYTGEAAVEISMHGSHASIRAALESCFRAGARLARPGEFTERSFLNGRIDLTQAEAVRETVDALTDAQLQEANRNRYGALRRKITDLRDHAIGLRAAIEASVDFSEEVGELDRNAMTAGLQSLQSELDALLATARVGRLLRHGLRIAIVGAPNVGKSSLLNALLGEERVIVTEIAGTTRDYVEERADFDGYPVVLVDTAGLRAAADPVEAIGIQRSRAQAAAADVIWHVIDGESTGVDLGLGSSGPPVVRVANKADLGHEARGIRVSARTGEGLVDLVASVRPFFDRSERPTVTARVEDQLRIARNATALALGHLETDAPDDLLSVLMSEVVVALGEITGETGSTDMVERIFHDFCVGK